MAVAAETTAAVRTQAPASVRRKRFLVAVADHSILIALAIAFLLPIVFIGLTALMTDGQALTPAIWPHPFQWSNFVEVFRQAQIDEAATFNFTPFLVTALLFLLITIPLARLTDWLIARDRRRQLASAGGR